MAIPEKKSQKTRHREDFLRILKLTCHQVTEPTYFPRDKGQRRPLLNTELEVLDTHRGSRKAEWTACG